MKEKELIEFQVNNIICSLGLMLDSKEFSLLTGQVKIINEKARREIFEIIRRNPGHSGTGLINIIKEALKS